MTLKDLAKKLVEQVKAGQFPDAMETAAEILKASANFYKLLFGTSAEEDLVEVEAELVALKDSLPQCSCDAKDGTCQQVAGVANATPQVNPVLILGIIELVLKLIAERRKNK
jgi:hypothetical protein